MPASAYLDYFRRPQIAGPNLPRLTYGTIRGSKRRDEADGTSTVPYFADVTAAQTLIVEHQGGTDTVILSSNEFTQILADLNTDLGADAQAFDADGCIGIKSKVAGAAGFVEVTGGTAAEALGFDTSDNRIISYGGYIESAASDRNNVPYGVNFPGRYENLDRGTWARALGRVSGNMDVLHSEHVRDDIYLKAFDGGFTYGTTAAGYGYLTLTSSDRVYNGADGQLSLSSTSSDLAPFFQLIDKTTKELHPAKVIGLTLGVPPAGAVPFSNATDYTDTGNNALGLSLTKSSLVAITAMSEGRVVECSGGTFVTDGVVAGDVAQIASATNLDLWDNNGLKWIVERVISETKLVLRPMAQSELNEFLVTLSSGQPVLELNHDKQPAQSYGTITIKTGKWCTDVSVVFDRPFDDSNVILYAASPITSRSTYQSWKQSGMAPLIGDLVRSTDPVPSGIYVAPTMASDGANGISFTGGKARVNGRIATIADTDFAAPQALSTTIYYYWDEATSTIKSTTGSLTSILAEGDVGSGRGHLLGHAVTDGFGDVTSFSRETRVLGERAPTVITVGTNGQFTTLEEASRFVSSLATAFSETGGVASGAYAHPEIVILEDVTIGNSVSFSCPGVTIRGANPTVQLALAGYPLTFTTGGNVVIRDLKIASGGASSLVDFTDFSPNSAKLFMDNVIHDATAAGYVVSCFDDQLTRVVITNCEFYVNGGIIRGYSNLATANVDTVIVDNCKIRGTGSSLNMFYRAAGGGWEGTFLRVSNCHFYECSTSGTALFYVSGVSDSTLENCYFQINGSRWWSASSILFYGGQNSKFLYNDCYDGAVNRAFSGAGSRSIAHGNKILTYVESSLGGISNVRYCLTASIVTNNFIQCNTSALVISGGGIYATYLAANNFLNGTFAVGVAHNQSTGGQITGNWVYITNTGTGGLLGGISVYGSSGTAGVAVTGNTVNVTSSGSTGGGIVFQNSGGTLHTCTGNTVRVYDAEGIYVGSNDDGVTVSGNQVTVTSTGASTNSGIYMSAAAGVVTGNVIYPSVSGQYGIRCGSSFTGNISDNAVYGHASSVALYLETSSQLTTVTVQSNYFYGSVSGHGSHFVDNTCNGLATINCLGSTGYHFNISGNKFLSTSAMSISIGAASELLFEGNTVKSTSVDFLVSSSSPDGGVRIVGNLFLGEGNAGTAAHVYLSGDQLDFIGNYVYGKVSWGYNSGFTNTAVGSIVSNTIVNPSTGAVAGTDFGLRIGPCSDTVVSGNRIIASFYAVYVANASVNHVLITGNHLEVTYTGANTARCVYVEDGDYTSILSNHLKKATGGSANGVYVQILAAASSTFVAHNRFRGPASGGNGITNASATTYSASALALQNATNFDQGNMI